MIHKSHSKKDLYSFIQVFKIPIYNNEFTKKQLIKVLTDAIASGLFHIKDNNKYLISNEKELKDYIGTCNPKKILSVKDKKQLILDCRKINQYCLNHYSIKNTTFTSEDEVITLVKECSKYGDIPSVRKMIKKINLNPMNTEHIKPIISKIKEKELNDNRLIKKVYMENLIVKEGNFILSFS